MRKARNHGGAGQSVRRTGSDGAGRGAAARDRAPQLPVPRLDAPTISDAAFDSLMRELREIEAAHRAGDGLLAHPAGRRLCGRAVRARRARTSHVLARQRHGLGRAYRVDGAHRRGLRRGASASVLRAEDRRQLHRAHLRGRRARAGGHPRRRHHRRGRDREHAHRARRACACATRRAVPSRRGWRRWSCAARCTCRRRASRP